MAYLGSVAVGDDHTPALGHRSGNALGGLAYGRELVGKALVLVVDDEGVAADGHHGQPVVGHCAYSALIALKYDYPTRLVTVHVDWWDLTDSTLMGLRRGERLSIEDLLYGLMLPSGNDAAIARAVAGSEANSVALTSAEAQPLGLQETHFVNPHGLDQEGHYTSACAGPADVPTWAPAATTPRQWTDVPPSRTAAVRTSVRVQ